MYEIIALRMYLCYVDILEGNLTSAMEKKYTEACKEVLQEIQHAMTKNGENKESAFVKYQSEPLLCEKVASRKYTVLTEIILNLKCIVMCRQKL